MYKVGISITKENIDTELKKTDGNKLEILILNFLFVVVELNQLFVNHVYSTEKLQTEVWHSVNTKLEKQRG